MNTSIKDLPGRHCRYVHRVTVNSSVETAWDVITDLAGAPQFTMLNSKLVKEGEGHPHGLGAIREGYASQLGDLMVREIVNYWVPHRLFGYHQIDGKEHQPSHHQGIVRFFPREKNRCEWVFTLQLMFTPKMEELFPGIDLAFDKGYLRLMQDYEAECERRGHEIEIPICPPSVQEHAINYGLKATTE